MPTGPIDLSAVYGFAPNDVWAVGKHIYENPNPPPNFLDSSLVIHYNGNSWQEVTLPQRFEELTCIVTGQQNEIWAGGREGTIYHLQGSLVEHFHLGTEFFISSITRLSSGMIYATGNREDFTLPVDSSGVILFIYNGTSWKRADSVMRTPGASPRHFGSAVWSDGNTLFSLAPNVYRYYNGNWIKVLNAPVGNIWKSEDNNIFVVGDAVYHFNGFDWKEFVQFRNSSVGWFGCYTDGKQVFILGNDFNSAIQKTLILHGK